MTQALRSIKGQRLQWSLKTTALPNEKVRESGLAYVNDRRGNALYLLLFNSILFEYKLLLRNILQI